MKIAIFETESCKADHMMLTMPNVAVTPHSAFDTREAIRRITTTAVGNVVAFPGRRPINLVSPR